MQAADGAPLAAGQVAKRIQGHHYGKQTIRVQWAGASTSENYVQSSTTLREIICWQPTSRRISLAHNHWSSDFSLCWHRSRFSLPPPLHHSMKQGFGGVIQIFWKRCDVVNLGNARVIFCHIKYLNFRYFFYMFKMFCSPTYSWLEIPTHISNHRSAPSPHFSQNWI